MKSSDLTEKGRLTFKYTSEFVFDKDFICEEGTELIIQPEQ